jgi:hypothetical protein
MNNDTVDETYQRDLHLAHLQYFADIFDKDPVRVAMIFVGLTLASARMVDMCAIDTIEHAAVTDLSLNLKCHEDSMRTILNAAWRAQMITAAASNDHLEGARACYYLSRDDQRELVVVGAQRWIETKLGHVRPKPALIGVTRKEIDAYVYDHPMASVGDAVAALAGDGEKPRPVDRGAVAEALLAVSRRREANAEETLNDIDNKLATLGGVAGQLQDCLHHHAHRYDEE